MLPGIAIAFVLGHSTTVGALIAAIAMVGGVQLIRTASPLPDDASIGVLFVGFLALAVVVMSAQRGRGAGDLTRFLFGSINAVDGSRPADAPGRRRDHGRRESSCCTGRCWSARSMPPRRA